MVEEAGLEWWQQRLCLEVKRFKSLLVGVFNKAESVPVYMNKGLTQLLPEGDFLAGFCHPTFHQLMTMPGSDEIWSGVLNFWDGHEKYISAHGVLWEKGGERLLIADYDVEELVRVNEEVGLLNSEVVNLQREVQTKNRRLEKALKELKEVQAQLIHSAKMDALGQLVAGVAHEINNPLAFIASNVHSVEESMRDMLSAYKKLEVDCLAGGEAESCFKEFRDSADLDYLLEDVDNIFHGLREGLSRVRTIVNDLRGFSRHDEARWQRVKLSKCIEATLAIANPQIAKQKMKIELDLEDLTIECYPSQLNQAFLNLIINALQASQEGSVMTIRSYRRDQECVIEFQDRGCGIDDSIRHRIFDPFFTTKAVGEGTGLGLSTVYKIVTELHNGTVEVESSSKGSLFKVCLKEQFS